MNKGTETGRFDASEPNLSNKPRGSFFCTKCGWSRRARPEDPQTVHCGNQKCGYTVTQNTRSKKEVREGLVENMVKLCAWTPDFARGFVGGLAAAEDMALAECSAILEQLVEAKLLKKKILRGEWEESELAELTEKYKKLRDEGWARALKWFGWDVEVESALPKGAPQS